MYKTTFRKLQIQQYEHHKTTVIISELQFVTNKAEISELRTDRHNLLLMRHELYTVFN